MVVNTTLLPDGIYLEDIGNELVKDVLNDIKLRPGPDGFWM